MKRKALLCVLLALFLLASAQPTAALTSNKSSTVIQGTARLPVINVIVPSTGNLLINPLELPVMIGDVESNDQLISYPSNIINASEVPITVDVSVTGKIWEKSDMTLASSPTGKTGTQKSAFVYFEIKQYPLVDDIDYVQWDPAYDPSKHIVVADGVTHSQTGIVTLAATTRDGEISTDGYAPFRLTGDAVTTPTNAWSTRDGIDVKVVFTFTPQHYS